MKKVGPAEGRDSICEHPADAEWEDTAIIRHGRPPGVLIGFATEGKASTRPGTAIENRGHGRFTASDQVRSRGRRHRVCDGERTTGGR